MIDMRKYRDFERYKKTKKSRLTVTIDKEILDELLKLEDFNVSKFVNDILKEKMETSQKSAKENSQKIPNGK